MGRWDSRPPRGESPRRGESQRRSARTPERHGPGAKPRPQAPDRPSAKPKPERPQPRMPERAQARIPERAQERGPDRGPQPRAQERLHEGGPDRTVSRVEVWIYGYHPAAAALANPARKILRVVATADIAERLKNDGAIPQESLARLRILPRHEIDQLVGKDAVHQGIAVLARPLGHHLQDVLDALEHREDACLVLLDQVTDPHNVGAILRSAAAFGASAVIAPDRHAPEETGVMAKSASGALDKVPYVKTVNLVRAIEILKEARFWLVGLEADAEPALADVNLTGRIALVLGAEGEGIRRLVGEACDHRARLPIASAMESLNVSNAAAVALYEKARQITAKAAGKVSGKRK